MSRIKERVGDDNIFIFGLKADEVLEARQNGYDAKATVEAAPALKETLKEIRSGVFSPDDPHRFHDLIDGLLDHDYFMVTADFAAYADMQRRVDKHFLDADDWTRRAVLNTANAGWFSSDRTIRGYSRDIWGIEPTERGEYWCDHHG